MDDAITHAQHQSSGLTVPTAANQNNRIGTNDGLGATVTFPFLTNPDGSAPSSLSDWLTAITTYVEENPLMAIGVGVGLILLATSMASNKRGRG